MSLSATAPACNVCLEPYNQTTRRPGLFSCGHTFCMDCISKIQAVSSRTLFTQVKKCPTCREETRASDIKINYTVLDLIPSLSASVQAAASPVLSPSSSSLSATSSAATSEANLYGSFAQQQTQSALSNASPSPAAPSQASPYRTFGQQQTQSAAATASQASPYGTFAQQQTQSALSNASPSPAAPSQVNPYRAFGQQQNRSVVSNPSASSSVVPRSVAFRSRAEHPWSPNAPHQSFGPQRYVGNSFSRQAALADPGAFFQSLQDHYLHHVPAAPASSSVAPAPSPSPVASAATGPSPAPIASSEELCARKIQTLTTDQCAALLRNQASGNFIVSHTNNPGLASYMCFCKIMYVNSQGSIQTRYIAYDSIMGVFWLYKKEANNALTQYASPFQFNIGYDANVLDICFNEGGLFWDQAFTTIFSCLRSGKF